MPNPTTNPRPKSRKAAEVTIDKLPPILWEREYDTVGTGGQMNRHVYQALCALEQRNGPTVGVRVSLMFDPQYHLTQSYAVAEVFDGTAWHAIANLPASWMRCGGPKLAPNATPSWNEHGAVQDLARLLEDARLALELRAPGPGEYDVDHHRVVVSHEPLSMNQLLPLES